MFDDFTERARRVIVLARDEARLLEHAQVGTEHILLGLVRQSDGEAAGVLKPFGITLPSARQAVEAIVERGHTPLGEDAIPFTPRAEKVLELGAREAYQLGHDHVDSEHLLMGLVREGDGIGAQVLRTSGIDLSHVHWQLRQRLVGDRPTVTVSTDTPGAPSSDVASFVLALPPARRQALREHPAADSFAVATTWSTHLGLTRLGLTRLVEELDKLPEYRQARVRIGRITRPAARARYQAAALHGNRMLTVAMARDHDRQQNTTIDRIDELNTCINSALRGIGDLRRTRDEQRRDITGALAVLADLDRAHDLARTMADDLDIEAAGNVARDLDQARRHGREITVRLAVDFVRDQAARPGHQLDLPLLNRVVIFVIDHLVDIRTSSGGTEDEQTLSRLLRNTTTDRAPTLVWLRRALST